MCSIGKTQSLQTTFKGGNRLQGIYFQVDVLDDINLVSLTGSFADAGHVYVHVRAGSIGEQLGGNWSLVKNMQISTGGQHLVPIGQVLTRGSYTLHVACSSSIIYSDALSISEVLAQEHPEDDNLIIYNGWGTADCDVIPPDRDYSGCPCRSWNGIIEYRCEVESVYRDQHLRRLVAAMHRDTVFADVEIQCGNQSFPAHRLVLASASPVFAKMLQAEMKEACTGKIAIEDVPPEVVAKALRYMYTGEVADDVDIESLGFAHKYDITGMMQPVSSKILKNLSPDNVSATVRSLRPYKRAHSDVDTENGLSELHARVRQRVLKDLKLIEAPEALLYLDGLKRTVLHLALLRWRTDLVKLLLTYEDDPRFAELALRPYQAGGDKDKDQVPCHHLALSGVQLEHAAASSLQCLQLLLELPLPLVQQVDNSGRNALHVACSFGSADAVQMLLAKGAEAGLQDDHGLLPLHYAIDSRSVPCVQAVLQASDQSLFPNELNPFYRCIERQAWEVALLLHKRNWNMGDEAEIDRIFCFAKERGLDKEWEFVCEKGLEGASAMEEVVWNAEVFKEPGTVLVTHPLCTNHRAIPKDADDPEVRLALISRIPENPHRLEVLCGPNGVLRADQFRDLRWIPEASQAALVDVLRVHEFWYVKKLMDKVEEAKGYDSRHLPVDAGDTKVSEESWSAASRAAGAVLEAVDQVCNETARNAFCCVRPPGHHLGPAGAVDKQALEHGLTSCDKKGPSRKKNRIQTPYFTRILHTCGGLARGTVRTEIHTGVQQFSIPRFQEEYHPAVILVMFMRRSTGFPAFGR
eukprot:s3233_g2.t1